MLSHHVAPEPRLWFPATGPDADIVLSTEIALARNLSTLPFVHQMSPEDRLSLRRNVEEVFHAQEEEYHLFDGEQMNADVVTCYRARGYFGGEGAVPLAVRHDRTASIVRLDGTQHLVITARAGGFDLQDPRRRCQHLDQRMEDGLDYAVSLQLGYLGPEIERVGTGFMGAIDVHLPALEQSEGANGVAAESPTGGQGEAPAIVTRQDGGIYRLEYLATAGESEDESLAALAGTAERLVHYEREARAELVRLHGDAIAEAGYRALGTLLHARRLGASESAELFDVLRFAAAAGLVEDGISLPVVTELMMMSHDSQVTVLAGDQDSALDVRRARLIKTLHRELTGLGE